MQRIELNLQQNCKPAIFNLFQIIDLFPTLIFRGPQNSYLIKGKLIFLLIANKRFVFISTEEVVKDYAFSM